MKEEKGRGENKDERKDGNKKKVKRTKELRGKGMRGKDRKQSREREQD